jgi:predicted aspartyl protease
MYTWVSGASRRELGARPTERRRVLTIEGRAAERGMAEILLTLDGRTLHTLCLFGEPGDLEVLGAYTLEGFGLAIDSRDPPRRGRAPGAAQRTGVGARGVSAHCAGSWP